MYDLANLDYDQLDTILDYLYDEDGLVLEFTNFTQDSEDYILGRGWTIWVSDGVLYVENSIGDNSAWID
jgi:hypothetical protein